LSPASVCMGLGVVAAALLVAVFLYTARVKGAKRWKSVTCGTLAASGAIAVGAWLMASAGLMVWDAAGGLTGVPEAARSGSGAPRTTLLMVWDTALWLTSVPEASRSGSGASDPTLLAAFLVTSAIACWQLRSLYIQYLGDVAIYLSSNQLNEFHELREQIRKAGAEVACAVYGARNESDTGWEYEDVIVVGHSLGSVVAYDTLNTVLNDDRILPIEINADTRTRALVTFGSPLDKSAFFFRTQMGKARFREALAAAKQPLIEPLKKSDGKQGEAEVTARSIPWINIYSPFDPISGPVNFYDPPKGDATAPAGTEETRVRNERDPDAVLFGAAHTHYWKNPMLMTYLHYLATVPRHQDGAGD
ncbi:MAG TPA: hypothetical protein VE913_24110, partial [Longimicrobium sp.]|nr:hypothetical protein [Longimicrobium sp.]